MVTRGVCGGAVSLLIGTGLLLMIWIIPVSAETDGGNNYSKSSFQSGSWSLQFGIASDLRLTSFEGLLLSCKRHWSPRSALRLGITVNASINDRDDDVVRDYGTDALETSYDRDGNSSYLGIDLLHLHYPISEKRISVFVGVGPSLDYRRSLKEQDEIDDRDGPNYKTRSWTYTRSVYGGIRGVLGVEWFATDNISLLADYGGTLRYLDRYSETSMISRDRNNWSRQSDHRVELNSDGVQFGLSVYF